MITMLAAISGEAVVTAVVYLIIMGLVFWLLWWLLEYCAVPEPFNKVARILLAVLAVIVIINVLLSMIGRPLIVW